MRRLLVAMAMVGGAICTTLPVQAAGAKPAAAPAPTSASPSADSLYDMLEQEKQAHDVYKLYFPSLQIGRRAAITLHAQLFEIDYAAGYLIAELSAADIDRLRPFGFRFEPATEFIQRRNLALTQAQIRLSRQAGAAEPQAIPGYACYETVEETFAAGDAIVAAKPTLATWVNAGSSWLKTQNAGGYDMKVLKLTNSAMGAVGGADKPKLFINSAIHAREYTTAPLVLEFARWLSDGYGVDADATWILDHHEVHLMLHANPDGRKRAEAGLSWRKNVNNNYCSNSNNRGADLNRNFSATWNTTNGEGSSGSACQLTYRGPSAGSEPETRAVESYIRSLWPDRRGPGPNDAAPADTSGVHLDIHSFSQLVLWPWGETAAPAPNATQLQTLGRRLAFFNGYTPQQSIGLYPTDGTSNAPSYHELGVASFTIELGTAFFESCANYINSTRPGNLPALIYTAKVVRTPYITPAGPDVTALTLAGAASSTGVQAGSSVLLNASATDVRFNQSNGVEATQAISHAEYTIDVPPWQADAVPRPLNAADGSFGSSTEALSGRIDTWGLGVGRHLVYVRARDASGTWGPVSAVFLTINAPVPLSLPEQEVNNSPALAQTVPALPAQYAGAMDSPMRSERSDTDFYRVSVAPGKALVATLTPNASSDYNLHLLDASGATVAASTLGAGQVDQVEVANNTGAPLSFYVRVSYASGLKGPAGTYLLQLSE